MNLKEEIKKQGRKITWVAEKIGVQQPVLSMWLNGDRKMPEEYEKKIKELLK